MDHNQLEDYSTNEEDDCIQSTIAPTEDNFQDTFLFDFFQNDLIEKYSVNIDHDSQRKLNKKSMNKLIIKNLKIDSYSNQKKLAGIKKVKNNASSSGFTIF